MSSYEYLLDYSIHIFNNDGGLLDEYRYPGKRFIFSYLAIGFNLKLGRGSSKVHNKNNMHAYFRFKIINFIKNLFSRKVRRANQSSWNRRCKLFFCCSFGQSRKIKVLLLLNSMIYHIATILEIFCGDCPTSFRVL